MFTIPRPYIWYFYCGNKLIADGIGVTESSAWENARNSHKLLSGGKAFQHLPLYTKAEQRTPVSDDFMNYLQKVEDERNLYRKAKAEMRKQGKGFYGALDIAEEMGLDPNVFASYYAFDTSNS